MKLSLQEQLEQEYLRFIEFGNLLNRQMRKYLVQYLQNKLHPDQFIVPELNDQYFQYFQKALDRIFAINDLLPICKSNEKISYQLVLDTLYWLRKTYQKVRAKHPYTEEEDRLTNWSITPISIFLTRWPFLIEYLKQIYSKDQLDVSFYQNQFQQLIGNKGDTNLNPATSKKIDLLLSDLLAQWDALLYAKIFEYQLQKFEAEHEQYVELLQAKVSEYQRLRTIITPVTDYLGWDLSRALWQETSFDVLNEYNDLLEDEQSLKELADLLGSLREAEIEIEEETFEKTIIRQEWIVDEHSKAEIVGIHESDDLNHLLSSEVGLLSNEQTELLFLKKFADKNLLTFRYEDRKLVKSEEVQTETHQNVRLKEKGPFIVCVDTSESMTGRPEQLAKVLCLGILKMAIKENRRAYLINFSMGIKTLDLYDIANSINAIAQFLRMSFYGGTDISLALFESIRQLKSNDYQDADVLVVSDFIMYKINKDILQEVKYFQLNKGTQFHSLTLSTEPNTQILKTFDTNWLYDPNQKGIIKDLAMSIQKMKN